MIGFQDNIQDNEPCCRTLLCGGRVFRPWHQSPTTITNTNPNPNNMRRLFNEISTFLLGRKCYAVIVGERGSDRYDICSQIHFTKESAEAHRRRIGETRTYVYITTVTFRWRRM